MDDFDSAQFGANKSDYCGVCGMHKSESNECCKDEVKIFKIQDDQQASAINFKFASHVDVVAIAQQKRKVENIFSDFMILILEV